MPARRGLTMRQLRQMLRLDHGGVSAREIARTLGVARSTIQENLGRAHAAGIRWPLPTEWTDDVLDERLFARSGIKPGRRRYREPDWAALSRELKRPGVNLMVLWEEYRASNPTGYAYSRFCDLFRAFERRLSPVMRQHHVAGDKVFVDYSGKKIEIVDPKTGEIRDAEIFVAVAGASNYTFAKATWTQALPDWIEAHVEMFRFFQGVPRASTPVGPLTRYIIADLYQKRARQSGLPLQGTSSYCLRHSFAMRLLDRGVGVKVIGDLLGHHTLESTCVYLRLVPRHSDFDSLISSFG